MTIFGHVAVGYITGHARSDSLRVAMFVVVGALLPDVIDKPLRLLGVYPWSRTIGHSIFTWLIVAALVLLVHVLLRRIEPARWVVLGVATHFLADLTDDIVMGFQWGRYALTSWGFWPLTNPDWWDWQVVPLGSIDPGMTTHELAFILLAVWLAWRRMRAPVGIPVGIAGGLRPFDSRTENRGTNAG